MLYVSVSYFSTIRKPDFATRELKRLHFYKVASRARPLLRAQHYLIPLEEIRFLTHVVRVIC